MKEKSEILKIINLKKYFSESSRIFKKSTNKLKAVDGISFSIREGDTFGLVGESGCGKTTVARLILRLISPTDGRIMFEDVDLLKLRGRASREQRKDIQMIFQDPYSSLNPRWRVRQILEEPLVAQKIGTREVRRAMVDKILEKVGLPIEAANRYPHEFSGGQRQRIGIARALILKPKLVVCDEPISALDVSIQAQIINLLKDLQAEFGLTYIFITHDLRIVNYLCDSVGVIYLGKLVEIADKKEIFENPLHPYTRALLSAIPFPDPENKHQRVILESDLSSSLSAPSGCRFHERCPSAFARCSLEEPALYDVGCNHRCACFLYE
jgi:oligopeptide transport system ATP-binding protein